MNKFIVAILAAAFIAPSHAAENWVASWQASPHAAWPSGDFALPTGVPRTLAQQTVRETARISVGGRRVRIVLSNRYGSEPLVIGEAHVARAAGADGGIVPGTDQALTFGGRRGTVIPAGAPALSDALELPLAPLEKLAVSVYLPQKTPLDTLHWGAQQTGHIAAGNAVAAAALPGASPLHGRALLAGIWVDAAAPTRAVVAFGDSITDGNGSTPDKDRRWPDYLAARLSADGVAVVNAGISGARLLGDRMGANAAARFEQDVLAQPGVHTAVVLMGINDIGWPQSAFAPQEAPMTAERMIAAYRQLIAQARARGVRIVGGTLLPFEGALQGTPFAGYYTPAKDAVRGEVNQWIRESGEFDEVADFDALLRDPRRPSRMQPRYDSGDHLHPGDAGYAAIAHSIGRY
ncbi:SGNH/GDSL hydrolase family protein [Duganella sp. HH105]|uniref:SGNH/GDSL hydrolase family protein n=1 Tax=Duganella sp. HH105 TaxID=1781067 RepID=UPI000877DD30|nr:SGNH/GDSL hydrolase family protein [Duganella sp. HH105]OEZ62663.1 GDSL-like lipase/acylhydrolase [Duganella sp. HH105]